MKGARRIPSDSMMFCQVLSCLVSVFCTLDLVYSARRLSTRACFLGSLISCMRLAILRETKKTCDLSDEKITQSKQRLGAGKILIKRHFPNKLKVCSEYLLMVCDYKKTSQFWSQLSHSQGTVHMIFCGSMRVVYTSHVVSMNIILVARSGSCAEAQRKHSVQTHPMPKGSTLARSQPWPLQTLRHCDLRRCERRKFEQIQLIFCGKKMAIGSSVYEISRNVRIHYFGSLKQSTNSLIYGFMTVQT